MKNLVERSDILNADEIEKRLAQTPFKKLSLIVCQLLEDAILTRQLPPGTKINMMQIAQMLEISRTPVKEAVDMLLRLGLIVTLPTGSGYYVFDVSTALMDQLFEARRTIEGAAAYLCARRNNRVDLKTLKQLSEDFYLSYQKNDYERFTSLDKAFHDLLIDSCGNQFLMNMHNDLSKNLTYYWARTREYLQEIGSTPFHDFEVIANQHRSIYRSISLGVPDIAENAMKTHLASVYTALYAIAPPKADKYT